MKINEALFSNSSIWTSGAEKTNTTENTNKNVYDSVTISEESRSFLEMSNSYIEQLKEQLKSAENEENPYEDFEKYMKIATRIMHGDYVPQSDIQKLAEAYPDLFKMAILMKEENSKPKKYDKLFEDESKTQTDSESAEAQQPSESSEVSESSEAASVDVSA